VVHALSEVDLRVNRFHLNVPKRIGLLSVLIKRLGKLLAKFTFNNVGKGIWNLLFARANSAHEARTAKHDPVDRPELEGRLKCVLNEALDVKLQIQPYTFQKHGTGHSDVIWPFDYVFFAVDKVSRAIEMDPALHAVRVSKHDLQVEGLFVKNFDLKEKVCLQKEQINLSS